MAEGAELWLFDDAPIMGGAEIFALRLGRYLATREGSGLRIVCPPEGEMARRCRAEGVAQVPASFPPLGPRGAPRWPGAVLGVRSLLRRMGPEAIAIGNTARAQAYLAAAALTVRRRPPIVQIVHERDTLGRVSGRLAYRHVGSLVAMGGRIAALIRERLPGVPVWEANLFLNANEFDDAAREPRRNGEPVIGVLARFIPGKGQLDLVEELAAAGGWSRALLAGNAEDAGYTDTVRQRVEALGLGERVSVLDPVDDLGPFFDSIGVLVVPSTGSFEGQGMVIVEALAHGRPALVRRRVFSPHDYDGLPVLPYEGPAELEARLAELPPDPPPPELLRRRFGADQALEAILAAAAGTPR